MNDIKLPPKLQIYHHLRSLGFCVKPAYYAPVSGLESKFIDEAVALLDIYPNVQIRTAPFEKVWSPNKRNLTTREEIEKAYSEQINWMIVNGHGKGYLFAWNFFPDKELLSLNMRYTDLGMVTAELSWNIDQNETTKGAAEDKLFLEYLFSHWRIVNPELRDLSGKKLEEEVSEKVPLKIFEKAKRILSHYIPVHLYRNMQELDILPEWTYPVDTLLRGNNDLVIETATQFGKGFPSQGFHFVTDYSVIPRPI